MQLTISKFVIAVSLVLCLPAFAQAAANRKAASAARKGDDGDDVSHGLQMRIPPPRNDDRSVKIRFSPLVIARPGLAADVSMRVGHSGITIGALAEYLTLNEAPTNNFSMTGVGVNATYFFKGSPFVSSWYVMPKFMYRMGHIDMTLFDGTGFVGAYRGGADFDLYTLEALLGYQWHWKIFNFSLGAGPTSNTLKVKNVHGNFQDGIFGGSGEFSSGDTSTTSFGGAAIELMFGWTL
jgi:hypothetical protein